MGPRVIHVSEVDLSADTGMGRIELHWQEAFTQSGWSWTHIGPREVGVLPHKSWFPYQAARLVKKHHPSADLLLVHEPASGAFVNFHQPLIVESHGLERRNWQESYEQASWKTRLLYPLWRLSSCDRGLRRADLILLSNTDDQHFCQTYYQREHKSTYVFRNGVNPSKLISSLESPKPVVLFIGSWIERKGVATLVSAAQILAQEGTLPDFLLAGTGLTKESVLQDWPADFSSRLTVLPHFDPDEEDNLFASCQVFVLPSRFEGQPLSLLQAMAAGRCCIASACCGQKDVLGPTGAGLLFEPGDAQGLAQHLRKSLNSQVLRQELGQRAKLAVANRSWLEVSLELVTHLESLFKLTKPLC